MYLPQKQKFGTNTDKFIALARFSSGLTVHRERRKAERPRPYQVADGQKTTVLKRSFPSKTFTSLPAKTVWATLSVDLHVHLYPYSKIRQRGCAQCAFQVSWHQQEDEDKRHARNCGPRSCHFTDAPDSPTRTRTHTIKERGGEGGEEGEEGGTVHLFTVDHISCQ